MDAEADMFRCFSLADESSQESDDPDCSGGHGYDVWDAVSSR